jgi:hypothetical protein
MANDVRWGVGGAGLLRRDNELISQRNNCRKIVDSVAPGRPSFGSNDDTARKVRAQHMWLCLSRIVVPRRPLISDDIVRRGAVVTLMRMYVIWRRLPVWCFWWCGDSDDDTQWSRRGKQRGWLVARGLVT